jgi:hypothetical protein
MAKLVDGRAHGGHGAEGAEDPAAGGRLGESMIDAPVEDHRGRRHVTAATDERDRRIAIGEDLTNTADLRDTEPEGCPERGVARLRERHVGDPIVAHELSTGQLVEGLEQRWEEIARPSSRYDVKRQSATRVRPVWVANLHAATRLTRWSPSPAARREMT